MSGATTALKKYVEGNYEENNICDAGFDCRGRGGGV